jgi:hypothetical protein
MTNDAIVSELQETALPYEMMCMAESSFIASLVTVSMLCVMFSGK